MPFDGEYIFGVNMAQLLSYSDERLIKDIDMPIPLAEEASPFSKYLGDFSNFWENDAKLGQVYQELGVAVQEPLSPLKEDEQEYYYSNEDGSKRWNTGHEETTGQLKSNEASAFSEYLGSDFSNFLENDMELGQAFQEMEVTDQEPLSPLPEDEPAYYYSNEDGSKRCKTGHRETSEKSNANDALLPAFNTTFVTPWANAGISTEDLSNLLDLQPNSEFLPFGFKHSGVRENVFDIVQHIFSSRVPKMRSASYKIDVPVDPMEKRWIEPVTEYFSGNLNNLLDMVKLMRLEFRYAGFARKKTTKNLFRCIEQENEEKVGQFQLFIKQSWKGRGEEPLGRRLLRAQTERKMRQTPDHVCYLCYTKEYHRDFLISSFDLEAIYVRFKFGKNFENGELRPYRG